MARAGLGRGQVGAGEFSAGHNVVLGTNWIGESELKKPRAILSAYGIAQPRGIPSNEAGQNYVRQLRSTGRPASTSASIPKVLRGGAMASAESGALVGSVNWVVGLLTGTLATAVAVVAIASVGLSLLSGRMEWRRGGRSTMA